MRRVATNDIIKISAVGNSGKKKNIGIGEGIENGARKNSGKNELCACSYAIKRKQQRNESTSQAAYQALRRLAL